ncbi:MAG: hypothetical protein Kow0010_10760 [Dehalococcoidia bacterium]
MSTANARRLSRITARLSAREHAVATILALSECAQEAVATGEPLDQGRVDRLLANVPDESLAEVTRLVGIASRYEERVSALLRAGAAALFQVELMLGWLQTLETCGGADASPEDEGDRPEVRWGVVPSVPLEVVQLGTAGPEVAPVPVPALPALLRQRIAVGLQEVMGIVLACREMELAVTEQLGTTPPLRSGETLDRLKASLPETAGGASALIGAVELPSEPPRWSEGLVEWVLEGDRREE